MGEVTALRKRPRVGQLVVPYIVDDRRQPIDFKQMHAGHVRNCAERRLCGICGKRIRGGRPIAFVGPDDGRRCFADPWMHVACARVAMQQCPFLAARRGWRSASADARSFVGVYESNMALFAALEGRSHRDELGAWHFEALGRMDRLNVDSTTEER